MRLVHVERPADLGCGSPPLGRLSQFVENARLGQRQVGRRKAAVQKADLARVKPVEGADFVAERHGVAPSDNVVYDNTNGCRPGCKPMREARKGLATLLELQKNAPNELKTLTRAQNRTTEPGCFRLSPGGR